MKKVLKERKEYGYNKPDISVRTALVFKVIGLVY